MKAICIFVSNWRTPDKKDKCYLVFALTEEQARTLFKAYVHMEEGEQIRCTKELYYNTAYLIPSDITDKEGPRFKLTKKTADGILKRIDSYESHKSNSIFDDLYMSDLDTFRILVRQAILEEEE